MPEAKCEADENLPSRSALDCTVLRPAWFRGGPAPVWFVSPKPPVPAERTGRTWPPSPPGLLAVPPPRAGAWNSSGPDDTSRGWEQIARQTAHGYREMAYRHPRVFPLLATRAQTSPVALTALERLVTAMREAGLPDQVAADAPMTLFSFLNGYLLAVLSGEGDGGGGTPAIDAGAYPAMAALAPLQADFGSVAEFDRILDTVLGGTQDRAARDGTR
ncbi:TetR/AcrR family transcriptional regulator C-terminal domain-containing protein [Streptomyces sp. NPDC098085]|uniref:TetR/AcrR family transcriptional regulator C-terminal domain-containing protein n=1 Tax=Streptomyces sp. NPDC098085 TaxID=3366094 RepID=UPI003810ABFF